MSLLEVAGLTVSVGRTPLVNALDLTIEPGERVGLIGESGSGKSLTCLSILGLLPTNLKTSGSLRLDGVRGDLLNTGEQAWSKLRGRRMSMIFQEPMTALNPLMKVGRQVAEIMTVHGRPATAAQQRTIELLDQVGLPDPAVAAQAYPHQLSGGQRQRVMLSMAMANSPDLLLADEPTTALDVTVQAQVLDLMREQVREHNTALLFITHDLAVVSGMCERVLIMREGEIVETGTIDRVFSAPEHPYTRGLLAASALATDRRTGKLITVSQEPDPAEGPRPKGPELVEGPPPKGPELVEGPPPKDPEPADRPTKGPELVEGPPTKDPEPADRPTKGPELVEGPPPKDPEPAAGPPPKGPELVEGPPTKDPEPADRPTKGPELVEGPRSDALRQAQGPSRPAQGPSTPAQGPSTPAQGPSTPAQGPSARPQRTSESAVEHRVLDDDPDLVFNPVADPLISVRKLSRTYLRGRTSLFGSRREVHGLRQISFDVAPGDRLGVVGESGSGKSTLLRLLCGLDSATSGSVRVAGTELTGARERDLRPLRDQVQIVFQDPHSSLDPRMRVRDVVSEPLRDTAGRVRRRKVGEMLEAVGLPADAGDRFPHQFSGGQRQRIAIARALITEPRILLADEAVSALDVSVRAQVLNLLADLVDSYQLTLVFVSHDLNVIRHLCRTVAVMQSGQIVECGPTQQVYSGAQHPYSRQLINALPRLQQEAQR